MFDFIILLKNDAAPQKVGQKINKEGYIKFNREEKIDDIGYSFKIEDVESLDEEFMLRKVYLHKISAIKFLNAMVADSIK